MRCSEHRSRRAADQIRSNQRENLIDTLVNIENRLVFVSVDASRISVLFSRRYVRGRPYWSLTVIGFFKGGDPRLLRVPISGPRVRSSRQPSGAEEVPERTDR